MAINAAATMGISGIEANPHIWYDYDKVPQVADAIAHHLATLDPEEVATFTANAKAL